MARKIAREFFDKGFTSQKWFFDYGPDQGSKGFTQNVTLVRVLREELGSAAELMFDCKWAWDVPYSVKLARVIQEFTPKRMEEPLRSENLDGYMVIKRDGGIPLAAGEHLYSRWEGKSYLDRGLLDYLQTDPEWRGGITELVKICAMAEVYGIPVIPHGHHIWAALHVIASRPSCVCPMAEYLFHYMPEKLYFQTPAIAPEKGFLPLPSSPGLGFDMDWEKVGKRAVIQW
jgi:L-rhamnonate dehydratase